MNNIYQKLTVLVKKKRFVFFYFLVLMSFFFTAVKPWQSQIIKWDISLYYTYLPAVFIYQDVGMEQDWPVDLRGHQIPITRDYNGKTSLKMSSGMAYLYAPWFFVANAYASVSQAYPADGFSLPYHIFIAIGSLFWVVVGAYFLYLFLRRFVGWWAAFFTVNLVLFGTNLFYYSLWEGAMSHGSLFMLSVVLLEFAERYVDKQTWGRIVFLGFIAGLMVLIRPIFAVHILVIAAFYLVRLRGKINPWHIVFAVTTAFLVWVPQMFYWHFVTGHWLSYSYGKEGFFWLDPQFVNGLFSWRKGWFIYTPVMLFILPGFYIFWKKSKNWFWFILILLLLHMYIIFSWWCWWYGGSYGMRAMIDMYGLLALPLAYFTQFIFSKKWFVFVPITTVLLTLIVFNLKMSSQYANDMIHYDAMTKEAYFIQFLQEEWQPGYKESLDEPNYEEAMKGSRD